MRLSNIQIVLVEPVYPGNVGSSARSARNFGVENFKIVGNDEYRTLEAKKMALYGYDLIENNQRFNTLQDAVGDCQMVIGTVHQGRFHREPPRPLWEIITNVKDLLADQKVAFVFGREDNGLTREEIDQCHRLAIIPTPDSMSFNLAHSVTVCLYETFKVMTQGDFSACPYRPTHAEYSDLISLLHDTLISMGFFKGDGESSAMTSIRDIIYRSHFSSSDLPFIKALLYKIKSVAERNT
jgi:TrmH family RNA methyltransferase